MQTEIINYPIPSLTEQFLTLGGCKVFSSIDLNSGYYQIRMKEKDIYKTAFITPFGKYEFLRMPFGLSNASRTFQMAMNNLLGHLDYVRIYLDDILFCSNNEEKHIEHVSNILNILSKNNITINQKKCKWFKYEIEYLGNIVDSEGRRPITTKLNKNLKILKPTSKRHIQKIIGFLNWFRSYIKNFSTRIGPITEILNKTHKFIWTSEHTKIVKDIFDSIYNASKIYYPNIELPFQLYTDASDIGIGSILKQGDKVVGLFSKKLNSAQKNYTVSEKEALAIVVSLIHFKNIIFNSEITIYTDHSNLKFLETSQLQRIQRWRILIEEFNPKIVYHKGCNNQCADYLSRCFTTSLKEKNEACANHPNFSDQDISDKIKIYHENLAHPGAKRLYKTINHLFENLSRSTVEKFTKTCKTCMENKNTKNFEGLFNGKIELSDPWETISIDIIGPHEIENYTKVYLLHIMDISTRYSELKRLKSITTQEVIKSLKKLWLLKYPLPKKLISDNGKQFISKNFESLLEDFNIQHHKTLPYNPRGNSVIERSHQEVIQGLRCVLIKDIDLKIQAINDAHNSTYHTVLKCSPMQLAFGRGKYYFKKIENIQDLLTKANESKAQNSENYLSKENKNRKNISFLNKQVYIKNNVTTKMSTPYSGPYLVIDDSPEYNCLTVDLNGKPSRFSYRDIKLFKVEEDVVPQQHQ